MKSSTKSRLNTVLRPRLHVVDPEDVAALMEGAFQVLDDTGVRVFHPEALALLGDHGARIDGTLVRIPAQLVEDAIATAPKHMTIYNRLGAPAMELGGGNTNGLNTYYGTGSDLPRVYDPYTGELRIAVADDVGHAAKVADYLPDMDFVMSYGIPSDAPLGRTFRTEFLQMVRNTAKPIIFTSDNGRDTLRILEMAAAVAGGMDNLRAKPFAMNFTQPTAPLQHSADGLSKMLACAEEGVPVVTIPGLMPGASAPVTMGGTCTLSLAEALSFLTIHQLKRPGAPVILGGGHGTFDMKTMAYVYCSPERLLTEAALTAVYQHYGIPTYAFGGCSDAQVLDEQAGMEFAMLGMWAALSGVNLAHDTGYLGSGLVGDLRALVFNGEINSYVRAVVCRGLRLDEETRALPVIDRVGPGGHFLDDEHTLLHHQEAFWQPTDINRYGLETWRREGETTMKDRLTRRVQDILASHVPPHLDKATEAELVRLLNA